MVRKKAATDVFIPELFGAALRKRRKAQGFSSAAKFSEAVREKTGVYIDADTMFKIERGEREPDVSKLVAMCITMYGVSWRTKLGYLLKESVPEKYKDGGLSNEDLAALNDIIETLSKDNSEVQEF